MTDNPMALNQDPTAENEQLRFALQAACVGTWDYNLLQTNQAQWSPICKELFGLSAQAEVTADILLAQVHPEDQQSVDQANQHVLSPASDGNHDITFRTLNPEGVLRWVQAKGRVIRNQQGQPLRFSGIVQEVTQQVLAQQKDQLLRASEKRFQHLIRQAPVAIALFSGPEFIIELANDRVLEFWGRTREQVMHKPLFAALPEARGQGFEALLTQVYTTGQPFSSREMPVELLRHGQLEATFIDFVYEPHYDSQDVITGVMVVASEITQQVVARRKVETSEKRYRTLSANLEQQVQARTAELAATNAELLESTYQLARSNDNLQNFASVASHDLQEPLRKIQQFGAILNDRFADQLGEGVDYLNRMQAAANRMSTLIRDLLAFSRLSTQRDSALEVPLNPVINSVLMDLDLVTQETGAVLSIGKLPTVVGDASQLGQLFQNLLSNALKFRRPDVIPAIAVSAHRVAADNLPEGIKPSRHAVLYHRIDVTDNGIGFDEKYVGRIFEVFQRLHGKNSYAGTGIGLAICEKVVTNHGGAITARSQEGQGATFSVYLPV